MSDSNTVCNLISDMYKWSGHKEKHISNVELYFKNRYILKKKKNLFLMENVTDSKRL